MKPNPTAARIRALEMEIEAHNRAYYVDARPQISDYEYELQMALMNRRLRPGIETVFLMADEEFVHVSSSLLKQIAPLADDEMLARFVPAAIIPALRQKIQRQ